MYCISRYCKKKFWIYSSFQEGGRCFLSKNNSLYLQRKCCSDKKKTHGTTRLDNRMGPELYRESGVIRQHPSSLCFLMWTQFDQWLPMLCAAVMGQCSWAGEMLSPLICFCQSVWSGIRIYAFIPQFIRVTIAIAFTWNSYYTTMHGSLEKKSISFLGNIHWYVKIVMI